MKTDWRAALQRLAREPLVHFLIAGAVVLWALSGRAPDLGERRILVNQSAVSSLVQRFIDSFHRPPSSTETDAMIRDYVADQVYYREALRLGLDKDDEVVVRRMRRKLEEMAVADAEVARPDEARLQALLDAEPARYAADPRVTFDQVYLGADRPEVRANAPALLTRMQAGQAVTSAPSPLAHHYADASGETVAADFGDEFATALQSLPQGAWTGPIASGLGLHLVRISARTAPHPVKLAEVHQRVENDWRAAAIKQARAQDYARMLKGYDVVIEPGK